MKKIFAVAMALGCSLMACGLDIEWETPELGLKWKGALDNAHTGITLVGFIGECPEELAIPSYGVHEHMVDGVNVADVYDVKRLGGAFCQNKAALKFVVVAESIEYIDDGAFSGCTALEDVAFIGSLPEGDFSAAFAGTAYLAGLLASNANDSPANARELDDTAVCADDNNILAGIGAEENWSSAHAYPNARGTKWFEWTAPKSGTVWFDTFDSDINTVIFAYRKSDKVEVAKNDDFAKNGESRIAFKAEKGMSYWICIAGAKDERGRFYVNYRMGTPVTLTLDLVGGAFSGVDVPTKFTVRKGVAVGVLPTPARVDYSFAGWYTKKSGGTKVTAKTKFTKSTKIYARWAKSKVDVTVTAGSTGAKKLTGSGRYAWGTKVKLTATPASGYAFERWEAVDPVSEAAFPKYATQYRKALEPKVTVPRGSAISYKANFVKKVDDTIELQFSGPSTLYAEDDGATTSIYVYSRSYPTAKASGLPGGVKFKAVAGYDYLYALLINAPKKVPVGRHVVKVTAKNRSGNTVKKNVVVWGKNNLQAVNKGFLTMANTLARNPNKMTIGVSPVWSDYGIAAKGGYKITKITGMPSGLKWDSKHQKLTGYPSKTGWYTFKFTLKKDGKTVTATSTFLVEALPDGVVGTFKGYTGVQHEFRANSCPVSVTIAKNGKISASIGEYKFSGLALAKDGDDYKFVLSKSSTDKKKKTTYFSKLSMKVRPIVLFFEDSLTGLFEHGYKKQGSTFIQSATVDARKNEFGRDADGVPLESTVGGAIIAQRALESVASHYAETTVTASGKSLELKLNKDGNGYLNGIVTLGGDMGSGSTVLSYEGTNIVRYLNARFMLDDAAIEVSYPVKYAGRYPPSTSINGLDGYEPPTATIWFK